MRTWRIPLSDRLAERRKGGKSLFQKLGETTDALPEDKGEPRRFMDTYFTNAGELEPEEAQAKPFPKWSRRNL